MKKTKSECNLLTKVAQDMIGRAQEQARSDILSRLLDAGARERCNPLPRGMIILWFICFLFVFFMI